MATETNEQAKEEATEGGAVEVKQPTGEVTEAETDKRSLSQLREFEREFERAFENFFTRGWLRNPRWEFPRLSRAFSDKVPNVNIIDREDAVVVEAELPGVNKDDLDVSLSENSVTIKASTRKEEESEEGDYHRHEISTGLYSRTLPLPAKVNGDQATADFKNGMLRLTLPKSEQAKRVSIKVD